MKPIPFTKNGFETLKDEKTRLEEKRRETVVSLSRAREMGDLSENGLYKASKMELGNIDRQLRRINHHLRFGHVIEAGKNNRVSIGNKVIVSDGKNTREFFIVGDFEADPSTGKISQHSPIGRALMGKAVGDEVIVSTPAGKTTFHVEVIS